MKVIEYSYELVKELAI